MIEVVTVTAAPGDATRDARFTEWQAMRGRTVAAFDREAEAALAHLEAAAAGANRRYRREIEARRRRVVAIRDRALRRLDREARAFFGRYDPETGTARGIEDVFAAELADILKE